MKTINMLAQKGGPGKSTLARHWAVAAAAEGKKVAIIDLDPQGTTSEWYKLRKEKQSLNGPVVLAADENRLKKALEACKKDGFDVVFIDGLPKAERISLEASKQADISVLPCGPTPDDISAMRDTVSVLRSAKKHGLIVINHGRHSSKINDNVAKKLNTDFKLPVCPTYIKQRAFLSDSFFDGRTVLEVRARTPSDKAAAVEIIQSWKWIAKEAHIERKARRKG